MPSRIVSRGLLPHSAARLRLLHRSRFYVLEDRDFISAPRNNRLKEATQASLIVEERRRTLRKAYGTTELQLTDVMQRLAVNAIVSALWDYQRRDLRTASRAERAKVRSATQLIFKASIDALSDRPGECPDPPSKVEAVDWLRQLVCDVPNNLTDIDKRIALDALTVLVALLPEEQPSGFVV